MPDPAASSDLAHCINTVVELIESGADDRRVILQIGYNLGRLAELTGRGRGPFWDRWKDPIALWDRPQLLALARELAATASPEPPET